VTFLLDSHNWYFQEGPTGTRRDPILRNQCRHEKEKTGRKKGGKGKGDLLACRFTSLWHRSSAFAYVGYLEEKKEKKKKKGGRHLLLWRYYRCTGASRLKFEEVRYHSSASRKERGGGKKKKKEGKKDRCRRRRRPRSFVLTVRPGFRERHVEVRYLVEQKGGKKKRKKKRGGGIG